MKGPDCGVSVEYKPTRGGMPLLTDLWCVTLDAYWHVLEPLIILLAEFRHSSGNATRHDPRACAQVFVTTALRTPLQKFRSESAGADNRVGRRDDVSQDSLDTRTMPLIIKLQRRNIGWDILDTQLDAFARDCSQDVSRRDPAAGLVDQHLFDTTVVRVLEQAAVQLPRLFHRHGLEIRTPAEFLVVVNDILCIIAPAHPVDASLVEMRLPQRVVLEYVLRLESQFAVDDIVVVGADHFVPIPRGGYAGFGIVCIAVDDCHGGIREFLDQVVCC
jgi:hypothetical protein